MSLSGIAGGLGRAMSEIGSAGMQTNARLSAMREQAKLQREALYERYRLDEEQWKQRYDTKRTDTLADLEALHKREDTKPLRRHQMGADSTLYDVSGTSASPVMAGDSPLKVAGKRGRGSGAGSSTAMRKDIEFLAEYLNLSNEEAYKRYIQGRGKGRGKAPLSFDDFVRLEMENDEEFGTKTPVGERMNRARAAWSAYQSHIGSAGDGGRDGGDEQVAGDGAQPRRGNRDPREAVRRFEKDGKRYFLYADGALSDENGVEIDPDTGRPLQQ